MEGTTMKDDVTPIVQYGNRTINPEDKDKIDKVFWSTGLWVAGIAAFVLFLVLGN